MQGAELSTHHALPPVLSRQPPEGEQEFSDHGPSTRHSPTARQGAARHKKRPPGSARSPHFLPQEQVSEGRLGPNSAAHLIGIRQTAAGWGGSGAPQYIS